MMATDSLLHRDSSPTWIPEGGSRWGRQHGRGAVSGQRGARRDESGGAWLQDNTALHVQRLASRRLLSAWRSIVSSSKGARGRPSHLVRFTGEMRLPAVQRRRGPAAAMRHLSTRREGKRRPGQGGSWAWHAELFSHVFSLRKANEHSPSRPSRLQTGSTLQQRWTDGRLASHREAGSCAERGTAGMARQMLDPRQQIFRAADARSVAGLGE